MVQRFRGARGGRSDTSGEGELHRSIGEIQGQLEMMREENKRMLEDNRRLLEKLDKVQSRVGEIDNKIEPLPKQVAGQEKRLKKIETVHQKFSGVVAFAVVTFSFIFGGIWALIINWSGVMAFARKMFGGP